MTDHTTPHMTGGAVGTITIVLNTTGTGVEKGAGDNCHRPDHVHVTPSLQWIVNNSGF